MTDIALGSGERRGLHRAATSPAPTSPAPTGSARAEELRHNLGAIDYATEHVLDIVRQLDDDAVHSPSSLPGWSRAHVLTHLARSADGLVNLLVWARTGVEHPMYASAADRDADIEEGATRGQQLLLEDLHAASARFAEAARSLPESAWSAEITADEPVRACAIPRMRLRELQVHTVDLDHGFTFDDIPAPEQERALEDVVQKFGGRPDVPALSLTARFADGHHRRWHLRGTTSPPYQVSGPASAMLGWLLGRTDADELTGEIPPLPPWL